MTDYAKIPNTGATPNQRLVATMVGFVIATAIAVLVISWPGQWFLDLWGPVLFVSMATTGVFQSIRRRRSPFELAIMEFDHLGLRPELIGEVIVENRAKSYELVDIAGKTTGRVRRTATDIHNEVMELIEGFKDDPSDVQRSRNILARCLDQSLKIMKNYRVMYNRRGKMQADFANVEMLTTMELDKILAVLREQHVRNMENNTAELSVDLEVSAVLFNGLEAKSDKVLRKP